ncbi:hypothetical protein HYH03_009724 [Edaphochlamys debaryana]|uniref:Uncharacterized protein n=1 Tax=Edaphochlamys debaryana TaxID=47281 RepID=A0A836BY88_9CHLO|nr:hypothetical protein HYH03_009724 [Edaphochlamys debaryana]|eukprot:KAG2491994.1 hypothetical protein HYH03_009724 [Edaphochlamys debaryana]
MKRASGSDAAGDAAKERKTSVGTGPATGSRGARRGASPSRTDPPPASAAQTPASGRLATLRSAAARSGAAGAQAAGHTVAAPSAAAQAWPALAAASDRARRPARGNPSSKDRTANSDGSSSSSSSSSSDGSSSSGGSSSDDDSSASSGEQRGQAAAVAVNAEDPGGVATSGADSGASSSSEGSESSSDSDSSDSSSSSGTSSSGTSDSSGTSGSTGSSSQSGDSEGQGRVPGGPGQPNGAPPTDGPAAAGEGGAGNARRTAVAAARPHRTPGPAPGGKGWTLDPRERLSWSLQPRPSPEDLPLATLRPTSASLPWRRPGHGASGVYQQLVREAAALAAHRDPHPSVELTRAAALTAAMAAADRGDEEAGQGTAPAGAAKAEEQLDAAAAVLTAARLPAGSFAFEYYRPALAQALNRPHAYGAWSLVEGAVWRGHGLGPTISLAQPVAELQRVEERARLLLPVGLLLRAPRLLPDPAPPPPAEPPQQGGWKARKRGTFTAQPGLAGLPGVGTDVRRLFGVAGLGSAAASGPSSVVRSLCAVAAPVPLWAAFLPAGVLQAPPARAALPAPDASSGSGSQPAPCSGASTTVIPAAASASTATAAWVPAAAPLRLARSPEGAAEAVDLALLGLAGPLAGLPLNLGPGVPGGGVPEGSGAGAGEVVGLGAYAFDLELLLPARGPHLIARLAAIRHSVARPGAAATSAAAAMAAGDGRPAPPWRAPLGMRRVRFGCGACCACRDPLARHPCLRPLSTLLPMHGRNDASSAAELRAGAEALGYDPAAAVAAAVARSRAEADPLDDVPLVRRGRKLRKQLREADEAGGVGRGGQEASASGGAGTAAAAGPSPRGSLLQKQERASTASEAARPAPDQPDPDSTIPGAADPPDPAFDPALDQVDLDAYAAAGLDVDFDGPTPSDGGSIDSDDGDDGDEGMSLAARLHSLRPVRRHKGRRLQRYMRTPWAAALDGEVLPPEPTDAKDGTGGTGSGAALARKVVRAPDGMALDGDNGVPDANIMLCTAMEARRAELAMGETLELSTKPVRDLNSQAFSAHEPAMPQLLPSRPLRRPGLDGLMYPTGAAFASLAAGRRLPGWKGAVGYPRADHARLHRKAVAMDPPAARAEEAAAARAAGHPVIALVRPLPRRVDRPCRWCGTWGHDGPLRCPLRALAAPPHPSPHWPLPPQPLPPLPARQLVPSQGPPRALHHYSCQTGFGASEPAPVETLQPKLDRAKYDISSYEYIVRQTEARVTQRVLRAERTAAEAAADAKSAAVVAGAGRGQQREGEVLELGQEARADQVTQDAPDAAGGSAQGERAQKRARTEPEPSAAAAAAPGPASAQDATAAPAPGGLAAVTAITATAAADPGAAAAARPPVWLGQIQRPTLELMAALDEAQPWANGLQPVRRRRRRQAPAAATAVPAPAVGAADAATAAADAGGAEVPPAAALVAAERAAQAGAAADAQVEAAAEAAGDEGEEQWEVAPAPEPLGAEALLALALLVEETARAAIPQQRVVREQDWRWWWDQPPPMQRRRSKKRRRLPFWLEEKKQKRGKAAGTGEEGAGDGTPPHAAADAQAHADTEADVDAGGSGGEGFGGGGEGGEAAAAPAPIAGDAFESLAGGAAGDGAGQPEGEPRRKRKKRRHREASGAGEGEGGRAAAAPAGATVAGGGGDGAGSSSAAAAAAPAAAASGGDGVGGPEAAAKGSQGRAGEEGRERKRKHKKRHRGSHSLGGEGAEAAAATAAADGAAAAGAGGGGLGAEAGAGGQGSERKRKHKDKRDKRRSQSLADGDAGGV